MMREYLFLRPDLTILKKDETAQFKIFFISNRGTKHEMTHYHTDLAKEFATN